LQHAVTGVQTCALPNFCATDGAAYVSLAQREEDESEI
jgi:hypothetical protein